MQELLYQFASHLRAGWRYRWIAIGAAWIIALAGWVFVHRMPDRYEATTRVWVDAQSVLRPLLAAVTVQPSVQQLVGMVSRTLLSGPTLERVIQMADLESEIKSSLGREMMIKRLSKEVTIQGAGSELFTITYTHTDRKKAQLVVQSLLTILEEGARSSRRADNEAAQRFLEEEINKSKEKLDALEHAVIESRRRQALAVGPRGDVGAQLYSAQGALEEARMDLKIAEITWQAINKRVADRAEFPDLVGERHDKRGTSEIDARVKNLQQKRDALRANFTDQHPDIVALTRTIAQLEEQKKTEASERRPVASAAPAPEAPQQQQLTLSLAAAEASVASAKARVAEYTKRYDELKAAIAAAPEAESAQSHLNRDYEGARNAWAAMVARRDAARMSEEMESRASVTNFRVVDPPHVSSRPVSPNRPQLNLMVLMVALSGGAGLAYLLSQLRPAIGDARRLREVTGAEVLGTVLKDWTKAERGRRTTGLVTFFASFASLLCAYVAINFTLALMASRNMG